MNDPGYVDARFEPVRRRVVLAGMILLLILGILLRGSTGSLGYDEGDYYRAVDRGLLANWIDSDDISTIEFIETGIDAATGQIEREELSRAIREQGGAAFYRHYHPPVPFYTAMVVDDVAGNRLEPEQTLRYGLYLFVLLWIITHFLLGRHAPELFPSTLLLVPATANWMASLSGFNMHIPFALAGLSFFLAWQGMSDHPGRRRYLRYVALAALAVALCSVEYSIILAGLIVLLVAWRLIRAKRTERKELLRRRLVDFGLLVAFVLMLWPAGVLKLGLLKAYALQAYIALFRLGSSPPGFESVTDLIAAKVSASPLDLVLLLGLVLLVILRWREVIRSGPLLVSAVLVAAILVLQRNPALLLPWYVALPFVVGLGYWLERSVSPSIGSSGRRTLIYGCGAAVLFGVGLLSYTPRNLTDSRDVRDVLVETAGAAPDTLRAHYEIAPALGGYFPETTVVRIMRDSLDRPLLDSIDRWRRSGPVVFSVSSTEADRLSEHRTVGRWVVFPAR